MRAPVIAGSLDEPVSLNAFLHFSLWFGFYRPLYRTRHRTSFNVALEIICVQKAQGTNQLPFLIYAIYISKGCSTYFSSFTAILITLMSIVRWLHITCRSLMTARRSYYIVRSTSITRELSREFFTTVTCLFFSFKAFRLFFTL